MWNHFTHDCHDFTEIHLLVQRCWESVYLEKKKVSWQLRGGELWRGLSDTDVKDIPEPVEALSHMWKCVQVRDTWKKCLNSVWLHTVFSFTSTEFPHRLAHFWFYFTYFLPWKIWILLFFLLPFLFQMVHLRPNVRWNYKYQLGCRNKKHIKPSLWILIKEGSCWVELSQQLV